MERYGINLNNNGEIFKKEIKIKHSENGKVIVLGTQFDDIVVIKLDNIGAIMITRPKI